MSGGRVATDAKGKRPPLSREFIELHRRTRFVAAAAELVHECGLRGVTVQTICWSAGCTRSTFYETFPNVRGCLSYGVGEAARRFYAPLQEPVEGDWLPSLVRSLRAFYEGIAAEPVLAELLFVHSRAIDRDTEWERIEDGIKVLRRLLARGREVGCRRSSPAPPLSEELLAHGYLSAASSALLSGTAGELPGKSERLSWLAGELFL